MDLSEYLEELTSAATKLKISSLARLSNLGPEQHQELSARWPNIDVRRRRRIVGELADLAEDNVELNFDSVFLLGIQDEDEQVRLESLRGLWEHEGPDLIEPLLAILHHDDSPAVRAEAALALGRFVLLSELGRLRGRYFERVEDELRNTIQDADEVEEVRARALEAIGPHDSPWIRQAISEAYESGAMRMKVSAVHAMGQSCEPRWLPLILKELGSEEAEVRYEAAVACGLLGEESAVAHLVPLLSDPDEEVKQASIAALGEIGGQEAKNALQSFAEDPSPAVREAVAAALAEIDFESDPLSFRQRF